MILEGEAMSQPVQDGINQIWLFQQSDDEFAPKTLLRFSALFDINNKRYCMAIIFSWLFDIRPKHDFKISSI